MNVRIFVLPLFSFYPAALFAQNTYMVRGTNVDAISEAKLENMTVCVSNAKDSILLKYTYTKNDGSFSVKGLSAGNFIILISYPDYANYVETFTLDAFSVTYDFNRVSMKHKATLLNEVIIKGTSVAIKIKGGTTEFNAKAYIIQLNDKVEDLLKQLPGIQVDRNGRITAQGQTVTFNRRMFGNNIIESTSSGIKRYFIFSVSWDFTKFGLIPLKD